MMLAVRAVTSLAAFSLTAAACGSNAGSQLNQACDSTTPCASGLSCGYAITAGCASTGICVLQGLVPGEAQCQGGSVACGCDGNVVAYGCSSYGGYAPAPVDLTLPVSACSPPSGGPADGGADEPQ